MFPRSWITAIVSIVGVLCLVSVSLCADFGMSYANEEQTTPMVGSFGVGGGMAGTVDERRGVFATQVPLVSLPGMVNGVGKDGPVSSGGLDLGVSYRQDAAGQAGGNTQKGSHDRFGISSAWAWNITYVDTDGDVRVFPASGGVFEADASYPSGLAGYMSEDLVFRQSAGVLPAREGITAEVSYAYMIEYAGGMKDYFTDTGDLAARVGLFGERIDVLWGSGHRLLAIVDAASSRVDVRWSETGIEIVSPARSDGVVSQTVMKFSGNQLLSVTNSVGDCVSFLYEQTGLLEQITTSQGAITHIAYQQLPDMRMAVDRVQVIDATTGTELSQRVWRNVGEHSSSGWPTYQGEPTLWASGDGLYRYRTVMSDGVTDVVSEFDSLGLCISRDVIVETPGGDMTVQTQQFVYPGVAEVNSFDPQTLIPQYGQPTTTSVVFRDAVGRSRTVTEHTEYSMSGQVTKHVAADGTVTQTVYDTQVPEGMQLPVGLILEETTTSPDGLISQTVNTLTPDHKSINATETFGGTSGQELSSLARTVQRVEPDGFVSEQRTTGMNVGASASEGGTGGGGAQEIVTRFDRSIDQNRRTITLLHTNAAETPEQSTSSTVCDLPTGLIVSTTDPLGRIASTAYDSAGRPRVTTDYAGLRTTTEYGDKVTRITDPRGVTQSEYVDVVGRSVTITDNITTDGDTIVTDPGVERVSETRKYERNSSLVTSVDALGRKTVTQSDVFGRPVKIIGPNGVTQTIERDDVANTVTETTRDQPNSNVRDALRTSTTRKDNTGRDVSVTGSRKDGVRVPEEETSYDGFGRVTELTSNDLSTRMELNANGTSKKMTTTAVHPESFSGKTRVAERENSAFGVPTKKTLSYLPAGAGAGAGGAGSGIPAGGTREGVSRVVDVAGHVTSQTDQTGGTITYEYTRDGLVSAVHNNSTGVVTRNTYDPLTRALTATETTPHNGSSSSRVYEYDPILGKIIAVFDPKDRKNTEIGYAYDLFGNTIRTRYPDGKAITTVFNEQNQKIQSTDIEGNITRYEYDHLGLLTAVKQTRPDGTDYAKVWYDYDIYGRITTLHRDNGLTTMYTFTSANEVATEVTTQNNSVTYKGTYEYDTHGNLTKRLTTTPTVSTTPETRGEETTFYTYNAYDQLIHSSVYSGDVSSPVASSNAQVSGVEYESDVAGNITRETTTTTHNTEVREFEYDALGHTTAVITNGNRVTQTYDAAGNVIQAADGTRYTYNVENNLLSETRSDGTRLDHAYWVNGQRKTVTTNPPQENSSADTAASIVGMYWDGSTLINETFEKASDLPGSLQQDSNIHTSSYLLGVSRHARTLSTQRFLGTNAGAGAGAGAETGLGAGAEDGLNAGLGGGNAVVDAEIDVEYYVTDRHGNTTSMVNRGGEKTVDYAYTDYGICTQYYSKTSTQPHTNTSTTSMSDDNGTKLGVSNPFQYAGEYTTDRGMQYLGGRIYTPVLMNFTTKDTANLFNLYAYGNANPITNVDPSGNDSLGDTIINSLVFGFAFFTSLIAGSLLGAAFFAGVNDVFGIAVTMVDFGSSITADLMLINDHKDDAHKLITDDAIARPLFAINTAVGLGAGLAALKLATRSFDLAADDVARTCEARTTASKVRPKSTKMASTEIVGAEESGVNTSSNGIAQEISKNYYHITISDSQVGGAFVKRENIPQQPFFAAFPSREASAAASPLNYSTSDRLMIKLEPTTATRMESVSFSEEGKWRYQLTHQSEFHEHEGSLTEKILIDNPQIEVLVWDGVAYFRGDSVNKIVTEVKQVGGF